MRLKLGFGGWLLPCLMALSSAGCRPQSLDDHLKTGAWHSVASAPGVFRNPILSNGADPWVVYQDGFYYYCQADGNDSISIRKSRTLHEIGRAPAVKVWKAPPGTEHSRQLWAAELHLLDGRWYIYYAASNGDNATHRMYVLQSTGPDATGSYEFKGRIAAGTDRWAIDGTILDMGQGQRYFVWSGWDGTEDIQQNLYIAPMLNPWTIQQPDQPALRLEAEQAQLQGATLRNSSRASGGQAVGGLEGSESFIDFAFDMPQSGTYQIDIRYAHRGPDAGTHELLVNGNVQTLAYPAVGADNFQTLQVLAPLVAGPNRLRFTQGQGHPELDEVAVKKVGGDRIVLSMPEHDYERRGGPAYVNEGPQVLKRNGRIHIIYSGSGSWTDDYNLIQLTFRGGDILNRSHWEKRGSVFARTDDVFGPGHASFTQSPDGLQDWIVYHAARHRGAGWDRDVRAQPKECRIGHQASEQPDSHSIGTK